MSDDEEALSDSNEESHPFKKTSETTPPQMDHLIINGALKENNNGKLDCTLNKRRSFEDINGNLKKDYEEIFNENGKKLDEFQEKYSNESTESVNILSQTRHKYSPAKIQQVIIREKLICHDFTSNTSFVGKSN